MAHLAVLQSASRMTMLMMQVNPNEGFQAQLREFERLGADPARWSKPWPELWGGRCTKRSVFVGV